MNKQSPLVKMLCRLVAAGWEPENEVSAGEVTFECDSAGGLIPLGFKSRLAGLSQNTIVLILPTHVSRELSAEEIAERGSHVSIRASEMHRRHPQHDVVVIVVIQGKGLGFETAARLARTAAATQQAPQGVRIIWGALEAQGKGATLNAVIRIVSRAVWAIGWVDDDIHLEAECLSSMLDHLRATDSEVVGATKIGHPFNTRASRILRAMKEFTRPAMNYPHGCCILMRPSAVALGIPHRYKSEDGYLCFSLLDPGARDPLCRMAIVREALCHHQVGAATVSQIVSRIRRILINHAVLMADFPPSVTVTYLRVCLFSGLWPIAPWDSSLPVGLAFLKWMLKLLYLFWFMTVAGELVVRGVIGRPLRSHSRAGAGLLWSPAPKAFG